MRTSKLRDMSITELEDEASAHSEQLFKLRLQKATGQLDNAMKIRQIRRELAQVKTILGEKEMEEG